MTRPRRLDAAVKERFQASWGQARGWIETGKIWVGGERCTDPGTPVDPSAELELKMNAPRSDAKPKGALTRSQVIYSDTQLIVVNKPAGISTVRHEKDRTTAEASLDEWVARFLKQPKVMVVHRLDRETSGLIVFARTQTAAKVLANQFRFHTIGRRYFALAHGQVKSQTVRSQLVDDRGDGLRGSSNRHDDSAKEAITHVTALKSFGDLTLVECRLETGRTHQIRIHLSELGHPLLGERAYAGEGGRNPAAPRLMLHAAELGIGHPVREIPMRWTVLPPEDFMSRLPPDAQAAISECLESRIGSRPATAPR